jgi:MFS-type transporter involved in bile tolerance (Atg22 family)
MVFIWHGSRSVCYLWSRFVSSSLVPRLKAKFAGSFLPVTLEQLARENGVLLSDGVTSCVQHSTVATSAATSALVRRAGDQCVVHLFGSTINTSSFALYSFSLAIFVQAIVLISIGAISDYGISVCTNV